MRRPRSTLLVLLLLTACTFITFDARSSDNSPFAVLRRGADGVLGPAQRAVTDAYGAVVSVGTSEREVALQAENDRLTGELRRSEELQRRVDELDKLLRLKDFGTYPIVPARVTSFGSAFGFASTVTIDAGSRDGLSAGQTVVNGDGLVGRTVQVGPFTSVVLLLVDPGFTAGARLTREGTIGLATGAGDGGVTYQLLQGGRVQVGDGLLTTGSETFVPGVPIGRVTAVRPGASRLVSVAEVAPFVQVGALDLVGVVTEPPRGTPRVPLEPVPAT